MNAGIIAVGSELLTPFRVDTNSLYITELLNGIGIDVRVKAVVGDDREELARVVRETLRVVELVVVTGGLGPTEDDVTRDAVAGVLGLPLSEDPAIVTTLERRFASRNLQMPAINRRQAMVPHGARVMDNANGTAPGLWIEQGSRIVVLLPGPPREMRPMMDGPVRAALAARTGGTPIVRRTIRVTGRPESYVDEQAQPVYGRWAEAPIPIQTTILAAPGQIELHLAACSMDVQAAEAALGAAVSELAGVLGADVFSTDGRPLEQVVGDLLRARGLRIALAESCTGGLATARLTDIPGSSDYVDRGVVVYSNQSKIEIAGVAPETLAAHGAVSEEVAVAMATGVRQGAGAGVGVAITGIAGPGGGTEAKPVGTVAIAVDWEGLVRARTFRFPGGREQIRVQAAQAALDMVRRMLESAEPGTTPPAAARRDARA